MTDWWKRGITHVVLVGCILGGMIFNVMYQFMLFNITVTWPTEYEQYPVTIHEYDEFHIPKARMLTMKDFVTPKYLPCDPTNDSNTCIVNIDITAYRSIILSTNTMIDQNEHILSMRNWNQRTSIDQMVVNVTALLMFISVYIIFHKTRWPRIMVMSVLMVLCIIFSIRAEQLFTELTMRTASLHGPFQTMRLFQEWIQPSNLLCHPVSNALSCAMTFTPQTYTGFIQTIQDLLTIRDSSPQSALLMLLLLTCIASIMAIFVMHCIVFHAIQMEKYKKERQALEEDDSEDTNVESVPLCTHCRDGKSVLTSEATEANPVFTSEATEAMG